VGLRWLAANVVHGTRTKIQIIIDKFKECLTSAKACTIAREEELRSK